jgi:hypothetical protein
VVRKLVEKFQPQASRSQAFGQYVEGVKKDLTELELLLIQRSLENAKAEVNKGLREIEKRTATADQFNELNTALTVLEKTLESVPRRDLPAELADGKALVRDVRARMARRKIEVDMVAQKAKVKATRDTTEEVVKGIQARDIGNEQLEAADRAIKLLVSVLDEGAPLAKADSDYRTFDTATRDRVAILQDRVVVRRILLQASIAKGRLTELTAEARASLETARQPEGTDAQLETAGKNIEAINAAVEANVALEKKDKGYAGAADTARANYLKLVEALELTKPARALRRATGEAAAYAAGGSTKDLRKQKEQYEKAVEKLRGCERDGEAMLKENPALLKSSVLVEGRLMQPKEVTAMCAEDAKVAEAQLRMANALIAFDEGPRRTYEAATALLSRGDKGAALKNFGECISSGKLGLYKYPEWKERTFLVGGAQMSVDQVVEKCTAQRKALLPQ